MSITTVVPSQISVADAADTTPVAAGPVALIRAIDLPVARDPHALAATVRAALAALVAPVESGVLATA